MKFDQVGTEAPHRPELLGFAWFDREVVAKFMLDAEQPPPTGLAAAVPCAAHFSSGGGAGGVRTVRSLGPRVSTLETRPHARGMRHTPYRASSDPDSDRSPRR